MIDTVYIEQEIRSHPRVEQILDRVKPAQIIDIERYGEVFNPKSQNFRLQKQNPALILASKHSNFVLSAPPDYTIGSDTNYYFSHMLNCIYDCRYCFLQGMYSSANYVVFVNYEDFFDSITESLQNSTSETAWYFSGYDCDSMALEPVTGFMDACLDYFETVDKSLGATPHLEIRTKSTQIRSLLKRKPINNSVIAYSLSPGEIANAIEHKTPSLQKRIDALVQLQQAGWPIGLRFDPLIAADNFKALYKNMFKQVFEKLDNEQIHSVSLGTFRLPKPFHRTITKLYPDEPMFAVPVQQHPRSPGGSTMIGYTQSLEREMMDFCTNEILEHIDEARLFACINTNAEVT